jgi:hypothetical protein
MRAVHWIGALAGITLAVNFAAADPVQDLQTALRRGPCSPAARAAWDRLLAQGPAALPRALEGMDTPDTVSANWFRTAFDRIADCALRERSGEIDADALLRFAVDRRRQGRARRLALELVERLRPGTRDRLIPGWFDDPEFRYDAVEFALQYSGQLAAVGSPEATRAAGDLYRLAFASSRDLAQCRQAAARLREVGVRVSVAEHLGFLTEWYVIGPLDAHGQKGFETVYPPEKQVDLAGELPGKNGALRWKYYRVAEPLPAAPAAHVALVNLAEALGGANDAVAYAYTAFTVPAARAVEFRGAADDNFTVWVNGERAFGFEEYRNGVRLDRHRFRVALRAGLNTVLVKVCQAPLDPASPDPNWEFLLRVVDETGKGIERKAALPKDR